MNSEDKKCKSEMEKQMKVLDVKTGICCVLDTWWSKDLTVTLN